MSDASRPLIRVAAGCLLNARGEVLIAQRPTGKIAAGYWEFPGGKIEPGETALAALTRELQEELGVIVRVARPLIRFRHDYRDRSVILDTWLIDAYDGEPQGRECQALHWVERSRVGAWPHSLPTVAPIAYALALPDHYVFTPPDAELPQLLRGLPRLPAGALLRLRRPALDDSAYVSIARALVPACTAAGLSLILDRTPEQVLELGAAGWHANGVQLSRLTQRPLGNAYRVFASCHDEAQLRSAQRLGCDAAVLGPVCETPTHAGQRGLGWDTFETLATASDLPVYAIGGVGPAQLADAHAHYAQGVAGIRAYWD